MLFRSVFVPFFRKLSDDAKPLNTTSTVVEPLVTTVQLVRGATTTGGSPIGVMVYVQVKCQCPLVAPELTFTFVVWLSALLPRVPPLKNMQRSVLFRKDDSCPGL